MAGCAEQRREVSGPEAQHRCGAAVDSELRCDTSLSLQGSSSAKGAVNLESYTYLWGRSP